MNVPLLKPFDENDWNAVRAAFGGAPALPFLQGWRETPEPDFRGGEVRLGWTAEGLWVLAQMEDGRVFTRATGNQQKLWTLGDVFEIFVSALGEDGYLELHTAPTGHWLQLRFPTDQTFAERLDRKAPLAELMVNEPQFRSWTRTTAEGWEVLACVTAIPARNLRASFGRYDYRDAETPPVISSTSPHRAVNFHAHHEWREFCLVD